MALKNKITAAQFKKLPEVLQAEYTEGDDGYILQVEGLEDTGALKRARDHEKTNRLAVEKELKDIRAELDAITTERDGMLSGSVPKSDVEKLETSYKTKLEKRERELSTQIDKLSGSLRSMLVDNVASSIASRISTAPTVILPHIKGRLVAELDGDQAVTKVLDKDGKPSALTVEELEKEILANEAFAPILTASKGSGGGASGSNRGGGAGATKKVTRDAFEALDPVQQGQFVREGGTVVDPQ